jgi:hypothetical protein
VSIVRPSGSVTRAVFPLVSRAWFDFPKEITSMPDKPKCAHCRTIAVASEGDVCGSCRKANAEAERKLLEDLGKEG